MGKPAAKQGDRMVALDVHLIQPPGSLPPIPVPMPFTGTILGQTVRNVRIERRPAAVMGSAARNVPPHLPIGGPFVRPPTNQGRIFLGSFTVRINHRLAGRAGDLVMTCNDPVDRPSGFVLGRSTVRIGG